MAPVFEYFEAGAYILDERLHIKLAVGSLRVYIQIA
jgi:hypothetical protein